MASSGVFGLITRGGAAGGARILVNEQAVAGALRPVLARRGLTLRLLNASAHNLAAFERLEGVVGVHGTAFGNIQACQPGTVVVEVTGALMPRTWANFALALRMEYFAYVARGSASKKTLARIESIQKKLF